MAAWNPDSIIQILNHTVLLITSLTGLVVAIKSLKKAEAARIQSVKAKDKAQEAVDILQNGKESDDSNL